MFHTFLKRNLNVLPKDKQKDLEIIQSQERLVPFSTRPNRSHIHIDDFLLSQGVKDCMTWRNSRLGKCVYDFALYPMIIWENSPATILEIGSGEGASAIWMADLCQSYGLPTRVYSIDIDPITLKHERVTFFQGNSEEIDSIFDVKNLPHPWLIVEDAHVNVNNIMSYFEKHMDVADYLIIEDSWGKPQTTLQVPNTLLVDAYYCDYFGLNATSAMNSILRKN